MVTVIVEVPDGVMTGGVARNPADANPATLLPLPDLGVRVACRIHIVLKGSARIVQSCQFLRRSPVEQHAAPIIVHEGSAFPCPGGSNVLPFKGLSGEERRGQ